jgi:hypothetical protein
LAKVIKQIEGLRAGFIRRLDQGMSLMVHVTVGDGRYAGAAEIPQDLRGPYWTTFVNAYPIAKGKQHLHVSISYGSRTDQKVIKQIKEMLESMIDDDPTVKTKELGAHN